MSDHDLEGSRRDGLRSEGESNRSSLRAEWQSRNVDARSRSWLETDAAYFMHQSLSTPCIDVLARCQGAYLETLQGKRFLDFHGNSVHQVGFGHPKVIEAVRRQMETLPFCPRRFTNVPAIELAKKLALLAPGDLGKVLFAPGGTSAIGMALKLARMATGRFKTVSMWDAFHGASLDAVSIGGESLFRRGVGPLLPGTEHVPPPDPRHCPFACGNTCTARCADYVDYVLDKEGDVAAVIGETVRSTPYIPPPDYWTKIRKACDRHGALLILDEVPNCLGRTGKMFACEHYGMIPDMLVIGKGLGGGVFPLAALIARPDLDVAPDFALGHYTHEKNPVGCAAALAAIEVVETEGLCARAAELGVYALERLAELKTRQPAIADVRGIGLLLGVEVDAGGGDTAALAERALYAALEGGLSFKISMGNILTLTPPLTISRDELDAAMDILETAVALAARGITRGPESGPDRT
ncbi:MAG TPA: aspartate aminotransferase family protein [Gammaproteobacteria bacterium]